MASYAARRLFTTSARRMAAAADPSKEALAKESKRNPELMVLGAVMVAAFGGAGYYFAGNPTKSTSEEHVSIAKDGMPWQSDSDGKYKYHPGGDVNAAPRDAPSALNAVVLPKVTLPKEVHDKLNKWGKEGYP